ncbi:MAG: mucoidy inhibitor MuiA family protein [Saprospiraceae bacterium]
MKNTLFLFISILNLIPLLTTAQSEPLLVNSTIESVKVYLQGASIERKATANLSNGTSEITFTNLSPKINPQSIRVNVPAGVTILSLTNRSNFLKRQTESEAIQQLRAELEKKQVRFKDLEDQINGFTAEQKLLETNQKLVNEERNLSMTEILAAANLYRQRMTEIRREMSNLERERGDWQKEIQELQRQINQEAGQREYSSEIYVTVKSDAIRSANFTLEYVVNDAGWAPAYDLFAGELTAPIQLKYRALTYNNSGLDWENIPITLSTADPLKSADQPNLKPWKLRENAVSNLAKGQGRLNYQQGQANNYLHDLNPNIRYEEEETEFVNNVQFETIEIADVNIEFNIDERYTIPSNAKPYSIDITEYELPATYSHFTVPKIDKDAFLLAQITGWEKLQLITGQMNIYRNNSYIGAAQLNTRNFTDTLDLSLGRDANVLVKRVKREELSKEQFLGSNKKWTAVYDLTIKNNHAVPINIEVLDQIPISTNKDITVDVQEISKAVYNENTGKLSWNFKLAAANSKKLTVGFSVKYPKGQSLELQQMEKRAVPKFY